MWDHSPWEPANRVSHIQLAVLSRRKVELRLLSHFQIRERQSVDSMMGCQWSVQVCPFFWVENNRGQFQPIYNTLPRKMSVILSHLELLNCPVRFNPSFWVYIWWNDKDIQYARHRRSCWRRWRDEVNLSPCPTCMGWGKCHLILSTTMRKGLKRVLTFPLNISLIIELGFQNTILPVKLTRCPVHYGNLKTRKYRSRFSGTVLGTWWPPKSSRKLAVLIQVPLPPLECVLLRTITNWDVPAILASGYDG